MSPTGWSRDLVAIQRHLIVVVIYGFSMWSTSAAAETGQTAVDNSSQTINETGVCSHPNDPNRRYHVATVDLAYVRAPLLGAAWVFFVCLAKIGFHSHPKLTGMFPESCLLIIIGVVVGGFLFLTEKGYGFKSGDLHRLETDIFFLVILPPIIAEAGYYMPTRPFFEQLGTIILHAVLGTLANTALIGVSLWAVGLTGAFGNTICLPLLHALVFASLLAAVDPVAVLAVFEAVNVNEILYIVIFGESLLNDGVSVVLYKMFKEFSEMGFENVMAVDYIFGVLSFVVVIVGALGIGVVCGLTGAFISRFTYRIRTMEPLVVITICYLSFILAELFHLSGIISCTFCGISMRKYVEANISHHSRTSIKYILKVTATVAESIVFMYLGIAAVSELHVWNTAFVILTLLFCLVYRAVVVIVLTYGANRFRMVKMTAIDQFVMSYGGLRGAIAFALVVILEEEKFDSYQLFVTTTIVVVYFTNLVLGGTMKPIVRLLRVKTQPSKGDTVSEAIVHKTIDHVMFGIEAIAKARGNYSMRKRFSHFDNKFLKPLLIRRKGKHTQFGAYGSGIVAVHHQQNINDAIRVAQMPSTAEGWLRWNDSARNLAVINRSRLPYGLPVNMSDITLTNSAPPRYDSRDGLRPPSRNTIAWTSCYSRHRTQSSVTASQYAQQRDLTTPSADPFTSTSADASSSGDIARLLAQSVAGDLRAARTSGGSSSTVRFSVGAVDDDTPASNTSQPTQSASFGRPNGGRRKGNSSNIFDNRLAHCLASCQSPVGSLSTSTNTEHIIGPFYESQI